MYAKQLFSVLALVSVPFGASYLDGEVATMNVVSAEEAAQVTGGQLICKCVYISGSCAEVFVVPGKGPEACPCTFKYNRITCPEGLTGNTSAVFNIECETPCMKICGEHTVNWGSCGN